MCVCVYVCTFVYCSHAWACTWVYLHIKMCLDVPISLCAHMCIYFCVTTCMFAYVHARLSLRESLHESMCVCVYVFLIQVLYRHHVKHSSPTISHRFNNLKGKQDLTDFTSIGSLPLLIIVDPVSLFLQICVFKLASDSPF